MSRMTRNGTVGPVSRNQILRRERGQENIHFPCSADHEQDRQPYAVGPYSAIICGDETTFFYYEISHCFYLCRAFFYLLSFIFILFWTYLCTEVKYFNASKRFPVHTSVYSRTFLWGGGGATDKIGHARVILGQNRA